MEWIRISENKLKIMLTAEDAKRYALRCESMDLANSLTRRAFREILSDIRSDTGFDATNEKVYIQMYPSKEGGCELFVTKTGLLFSADTKEAEGSAGEESGNKKSAKKAAPFFSQKPEMYSFSDLEQLLCACLRLMTAGFSGESAAYKDIEGAYWLLLQNPHFPPASGTAGEAEHLGFLTEYGKRENAKTARLYLSEHGKCICGVSAVEILGMLK